MNKSTLLVFVLIMLFTTACATTGESYTDEGVSNPVPDAKASTQGNLPESSETLPEIAAYDDMEIAPIDTSISDVDLTSSNSTESSDLPEILAIDEPEIPAIDAPASE